MARSRERHGLEPRFKYEALVKTAEMREVERENEIVQGLLGSGQLFQLLS